MFADAAAAGEAAAATSTAARATDKMDRLMDGPSFCPPWGLSVKYYAPLSRPALVGCTLAACSRSCQKDHLRIAPERDRAEHDSDGLRALRFRAEPLLALPPVPYPATIEQTGPVDANATVAFRGARYSVPPGFIGAALTIRQRLGSPTLEIVAASGALVAVHRVGRGLVRTDEHRALLERAVLGAFSPLPPCERKGNHPPGPAARVAAGALRGGIEAREVVVDLARYAELVEGLR